MAYPATAEQVLRTLFTYVEKKRFDALLPFLSKSRPVIEWESHDNWNGGIDYYSLILNIPTSDYAGMDDVESIEQQLGDCLQKLFRNDSGDVLGRVRFAPLLEDGSTLHTSPVLKDDAFRIWKDGFRLFISHSSVQKDAASTLREQLAAYGITAFVAHTDIEPDLHWQEEIELALRSMDAMAALITSEFNNSIWTNQEGGFALGRNVPILRILMGAAPKGFLGRVQGIPNKNAKLSIVERLLNSSATNLRMRNAICSSLRFSRSFDQARELIALLPDDAIYSEEEKELLKVSLSNTQVNNQWVDSSKIKKIIK